MLAIGVNHKWDACPRKCSTQAPVHPQYPRVCPGLSFATKRIGPPCCTLFTFVTCCSLQIILSQNYLLPIISVLAENTLLKPLIISFCSSLGSTLLLIKRTTIDLLHLWVIMAHLFITITESDGTVKHSQKGGTVMQRH